MPEGEERDPLSEEAVEERLEAMRRKVSDVRSDLPAPPSPEEIQTRLSEAQRRYKDVHDRYRGSVDPKAPTKFGPIRLDGPSAVGLAVLYNLAGAVIGGWAIGWLIDYMTGGRGLAQAIGTLVGAVGGMLVTILMILKTAPKKKP